MTRHENLAMQPNLVRMDSAADIALEVCTVPAAVHLCIQREHYCRHP
jgi:hypothetical protein